MPHSTRSSSASAPCRIEWRRSRLLIAALLALTVLAAFALLACEMPRRLAWPLALLACGCGGWRAWLESRRSPCAVVVSAGDAPSSIAGVAVDMLDVRWRGSLAVLRWRDDGGRVRRLVWWPDTLPAAARRELRLAAPLAVTTRRPASMAP